MCLIKTEQDYRSKIAFVPSSEDSPEARTVMGPIEELNSAAEEVAALLKGHGGVPRLVRALNRQRTRNVDVGAAYPFLAGSSMCAYR